MTLATLTIDKESPNRTQRHVGTQYPAPSQTPISLSGMGLTDEVSGDFSSTPDTEKRESTISLIVPDDLVTVDKSGEIRSFPKIVRKTPESYLRVLNKWQGTIIEVKDDIITAHIYNLTDENAPREEITFDLEEVSPGDRQLIAPGTVFYLIIGYLDQKSGRQRISKIRFPRRLGWTAREVEYRQKNARSLVDLLEPEDAQRWRDFIISE